MSNLRPFPLGVLVLLCAPCVAQTGANSTFTIQQKTAIPGGVLPSGDYAIEIVDHLSDRSIVQITSQAKASTVRFLGVTTASTAFTSVSGPVLWNKGLHGEKSLRGFSFPTGERVEFVYPKSDAVTLANANNEGIVAVDPASEKRPELAKLSPSDLQLVTLWSLTPVKIGPENAQTKGMEAKRYVPETGSTRQAVASSTTPVLPSLRSTPSQPVQVAKLEKPKPPVKSSHDDSYIKRLPQTASYGPLAGILACLSLASAFTLRLRRTA